MISYAVQFVDLCIYLFPYFLRRAKMLAWLTSLLRPLQILNNEFVSWALETKYYASISGQVIYLEHLLNDLFDSSQRRIFIRDGVPFDRFVVRSKIEQIDSTYLIRSKSEGIGVFVRSKEDYISEYDFVVVFPSDVILTNDLKIIIRAYISS